MVLASVRKFIATSVVGCAILISASAAANSDIINIDTDPFTPPPEFTFSRGHYLIEWAGISGGGIYDAFNVNCPVGVCPNSGWRNDFVAWEKKPFPYEVSVFGLVKIGGTESFDSANSALKAYQNSPTINEIIFHPPYQSSDSVTISHPQPIKMYFGSAKTYLFNTGGGPPFDDDVGGVSLRVTLLSVPEPGVWALMLSGFAAVGAMLRRRRSAAAMA